MKQSNVKPIVFSVIAFLLLICALSCAVTVTVYHFKNRNTSPEEPPPVTETETSTQSAEPSTVIPFSPDSTETPTVPPTVTPVVTEPPTPAEETYFFLERTSDAGLSYQNEIIFLGDSTTYGMIANEVLPDKRDTRQVWHGENGTLSLINATSFNLFDGSDSGGKKLSELLTEKKPKVLIVTLGVGVSYDYNEAKFTSLYNMVIDTVLQYSPETKLICNSIYPVCATLASDYEKINNPDIIKANGWIRQSVKKYYDEGKPVYYLDSFSALVGSDGNLPNAYSNGDGLHLSAAGFEVILEYVRTHKVPG